MYVCIYIYVQVHCRLGMCLYSVLLVIIVLYVMRIPGISIEYIPQIPSHMIPLLNVYIRIRVCIHVTQGQYMVNVTDKRHDYVPLGMACRVASVHHRLLPLQQRPATPW